MKKQYLFSLLGLIAISLSFGTAFSSTPSPSTPTTSEESTSSNSNLSDEELDTIEKYQNDIDYFGWSIEQVSTGNGTTAAIINDDKDKDHLYTWGDNTDGELGLGPEDMESHNTPQLVKFFESSENIEQVSMGENFVGVLADDDLYTWGNNYNGRLGLGESAPSWGFDVPHKVESFDNQVVEQISMGDCFGTAVVDGSLYSWGHNDQGQLGQGSIDTENHPDPKKVEELPSGNIEQISTGHDDVGVLINDINGDHLYTWGFNDQGQLGLGDSGTAHYRTAPVLVEKFEDVQVAKEILQISMGSNHSAAVVNDGENDHLYTWGYNKYGSLGLGADGNEYSFYDTPQLVTELDNKGEIEQISMGFRQSAAIVSGDFYIWGDNTYGQLGLGDTKSRNIPIELEDFAGKDIDQISMGDNYSAAIVENKGYTWGYNKSGQLGLGDNKDKNTPQEVKTNFPYFINTSNDNVAIDDPKNITIFYAFETNINVKTVTTNLESDGEVIPYQSTPIETSTGSEIWEGSQNILDLEGGEYSYSLDLNYLDENNTSKVLKDFSSGTFNTSVEQTPEITYEPVVISKEDPQHTASVNYEVTEGGTDPDGNVLTLEEVVWVDENYDGEGHDKQLTTSGNSSLTGTLTYDKFIPNQEYENTVLIAKYAEGDDSEWDARVDVDTFTMASATSETTVDDVKTKDIIVRNATKAKLTYNINLGTNADGTPSTIKKVSWMNGDDKLASTKRKRASGKLWTNKLDPNTTYDNTTIKAEIMIDGEVSIITASVAEFATESDAKTTTVTQTGETVDVTSSTTASVGYNVDLGKDDRGKPVTLIQVDWMVDGTSVATSTDITGTLESNDFDPNKEYVGTTIVATVSDNSSIVIPAVVSTFKMLPGNVPTTVIQNSEAVVVTSSTTASVDYDVTLGLDNDGEPVTLTSVDWMVDGTSVVSSTDTTGTLTYDDFSPNKKYLNTTIEVVVSDGSSVEPAPVDEFQMKSGQVNSEIAEVGTVNVTSSTEANVGYEVTPGKNADGELLTVSEVKWMNGEEELDKDKVNEGQGIDSVLETNLLKPNQSYNSTYLVATMSDETTTQVTLENFSAKPCDKPSTIVVDSAAKVKGPNEATIGYTVTPGKDANGNTLNVNKVEWLDGTNSLASSTAASGTLEADFLTANQPYANTTVIATMSDNSKIKSASVPEFTTYEANKVEPEIRMRINNVTDTSVTFGYRAENGKDFEGNNYNLTEINVVDANGNTIYSESIFTDSGLITITGLESNTSYNDLKIVSTFDNTEYPGDREQKIFTDMDDFTTLYSKPVTADPSLMEVNQTDGTLKVQGSISGNDAEIISVCILNDKNVDVTSTSILKQTDKSNEVNYDVLTTDYDPSSTYKLQITYSFEQESKPESDLYLLDQADFSFVGSNPTTNPETLETVNPWVLIGSTVGFIFFALFSKWAGTKLFKHYKKGSQF